MKEIILSSTEICTYDAVKFLEDFKGSNYFEDCMVLDTSKDVVQNDIRDFFKPFGATLEFANYGFVITIERTAFFNFLEEKKKSIKATMEKALNTFEENSKSSQVNFLDSFSYMLFYINTNFHDCLTIDDNDNVLDLIDYLLFTFKAKKRLKKLSLVYESAFEIIL